LTRRETHGARERNVAESAKPHPATCDILQGQMHFYQQE
jgi:hypothetical protein